MFRGKRITEAAGRVGVFFLSLSLSLFYLFILLYFFAFFLLLSTRPRSLSRGHDVGDGATRRTAKGVRFKSCVTNSGSIVTGGTVVVVVLLVRVRRLPIRFPPSRPSGGNSRGNLNKSNNKNLKVPPPRRVYRLD